MKDYTIAEYVTLPSKGLVYPGKNVDPNFQLRSMTTQEEMKRLSKSEYLYKNLCDILDDCTLTSNGISSYDLCLGDYQYLLFQLRIITYGSDYNVVTKCPSCGGSSKNIIKLDEIPILEYDPQVESHREFELPTSKHLITLQMQTPRLIDSIVKTAQESNKRNKGANGDSTLIYSIMGVIDTVDGEKLNSLKLEAFVRNLPMMDTQVLLAHSNLYNSAIGVKASLDIVCDICGHETTTPFQMTNEFFRPTLQF